MLARQPRLLEKIMSHQALLPMLNEPSAHAGCSRSGCVTAAELKIWLALRRLGEEAQAMPRAGLAAAARGDAAAAAEAFARLHESRR